MKEIEKLKKNLIFTSSEMPFDGTISGLVVDNVQDALDYILATLKKNITGLAEI